MCIVHLEQLVFINKEIATGLISPSEEVILEQMSDTIAAIFS